MYGPVIIHSVVAGLLQHDTACQCWIIKITGYSKWMNEVTDDQVVRVGVSVIWTVLAWSGGHEFELWLGRT